MRANASLARQIDSQLKYYAEYIREEVDGNEGRLVRPFSITFHAEVGSTYGGYYTGYDVLHGTDRTVGDFEVRGQLSAIRSGSSGSAYNVTYSSVVLEFNDIVNANKKYAQDVTGLRVATNLCKALNIGPPRDYTLHIRWTSQPIVLHVLPLGTAKPPVFLKSFQNK
jgi:hypothetical protein